ncbi:hypothetical protein [Paucibacter soli]|uniref:hypothetical protein n=1 Tax=Paucibacter soli TaxID=3133433 RepID=UPI0030B02879
MTKPSFARRFSLEQFTELNAACRAALTDAGGGVHSGPEHEERRARWNAAEVAAREAFGLFLGDLKAFGLAKIPFIEGRCFRMGDTWNRFVAGSEADTKDEFAQLVESLSSSLVTMHHLVLLPHVDVAEAYRQLVGDIDKGDFQWHRVGGHGSCDATGNTLVLSFDGWQPTAGVFDPKNRESRYTALTSDRPVPGVEHHVIQAPSGELLVFDLIDLEAFKDAVKDPDHNSLETSAGLLKAASWYAQQHGFMSTFVGSRSPEIIQKGDGLVIANVDERHLVDGEIKGHVETVRWWATAIDKEILIDIVAKSMTRTQAEAQVEAYIEEYAPTALRVRPGQLHVYHTANHELMASMHTPGLSTAGLDEILVVISERELTWAPRELRSANPESPHSKFRPS